MALSFVVPDLELNNKMVRILMLLKFLSYNKAGNPVLSAEKIAVFDFFLRHPYILHSILKGSGKRLTFFLLPEELNSISKEYPNTNGLYVYKELKPVLQILLAYKFINAQLTDNKEAVYIITEFGNRFLESISSEYSDRLSELASATVPLQSESFRNLMFLIKPYTNGR